MPFLQAIAEKTFAHRKRRANKTYLANAALLRLDACRIDDVKKRHGHCSGNLRRNDMHGVRAEHDAMRASGFEITRGFGEPDARDVPLPVTLQTFDRREIHAMQ